MAHSAGAIPARSGRLPQVELIRALAVAWVFLFHLWSVVPLTGQDGVLGWVLTHSVRFGNLGVLLFNIVTGLVLALPHLGPGRRPGLTYGDFLRRRFLRICPNYYLALVLWTLVLAISAAGISGQSLTGAFLAHLLFVHTLSPRLFFSIVPAYWWLGLLAQFYLIFPILLRLFQRIGPGPACLCVCALSWAVWAALSAFAALRPGSAWATVNYMWYFNLPARLPEFALGMWLAGAWLSDTSQRPAYPPLLEITSLSRPFRLFMGATLVYALIEFTGFAPVTPWAHVQAVALCLLLVLGTLISPLAVRIGSQSAVLGLAGTSYSIYLLHQPILGYADHWLEPHLSPAGEFLALSIMAGLFCYFAARALDGLSAGLWHLLAPRGAAHGNRGPAR